MAELVDADGWQGVLLGVAAGYAAYEFGKNLRENDQAALERKAAETLSTAGDGETVIWASDDGGATARITPRNSRRETKGIDIIRDQRVETPRSMTIVGKPYVSTGSNVRLRAGPSTNTEIIGSLSKNDVVHAFGMVEGGYVDGSAQWVLIGKKNIALGYVHDSLVAEDGPSAAEQQPVLARTFELDNVDMNKVQSEARETFELDDVGNANATFEIDDLVTVGDTVEVATDCRTLTIDIVVDNATETQETEACRGPAGYWEAA